MSDRRRRIEALRAKADSTTFPAEAAALRAKADELAAKLDAGQARYTPPSGVNTGHGIPTDWNKRMRYTAPRPATPPPFAEDWQAAARVHFDNVRFNVPTYSTADMAAETGFVQVWVTNVNGQGHTIWVE